MSDPIIADDRVISSHELKEEVKNAPKRSFFSTGFSFIDEIVGMIALGDLWFIGGLPGSGKTTLLQTFTRNFAEKKIPCLWFSIELTAEEFLGRFGEKLPVFYVPKTMPAQATHEWIEKKILEAIERYKVKVVFIDDVGLMVDENVARHQNNIDIFDARLTRLKRFANEQKIAIIVVAAVQQEQMKKKKLEPTLGMFRGTAMIGVRSDTVLFVEKLSGEKVFTTTNENFKNVEEFKNNFMVNQDSYVYILKSRKTGIKKQRIKLYMDDGGDLREA